MNTKEYQQLALRTESRDFDKIKHRLNNTRIIRLLHGSELLSTEANEIVDMLKGHIFYGRELDIVNLKEECGDICWALALLFDEFGWTFEEVMEVNTNKLKIRYPEKFTEEKANNRDLNKEREILEQMQKDLDEDGCIKILD